MRYALLLGLLLAVGWSSPALAEEPPCEIPPEYVGDPMVEWCEEELRSWEKHQAEEAQREAREERREAQEERELRAEKREEARERARLRREWAHKPTVTLRVARNFSRRLLRRSDYNVWTVSCGGGRINRTHWRCSTTVYYGYGRYCTRIRVTGAGHRDGRAWFHATGGEFRPC